MFVSVVNNKQPNITKMSTDLTKAKQHLAYGDIARLARELKTTQSYVHRVISGKAYKPEIAIAVLRKAEQRRQEAEEVKHLQQAL